MLPSISGPLPPTALSCAPATARAAARTALVGAVLVLAAALRLWRFLQNPPLWNDEAALALNLVELSWDRLLTGPLGYHQMAPPGFLLSAAASIAWLGPDEIGLRAVPLIASLAACVLFTRLATRVLEWHDAVLACLAFACLPGLVQYAAEVKQYASDVLFVIALTLVALDHRRWATSRRAAMAAAAAGAAFVWFSHPMVLATGGTGAAIAWWAWRDRQAGPGASRPALVLGAWLVSAAAVAVLAALVWTSPATGAFMSRFWAHAFMPVPPSSLWEARWTWRAFNDLFHAAGFAPPAVSIVLAAAGAWSLWRRSHRTAVLLGAPVLAALAASALRVYPFGGRTTLYVLPALIVFAAEGVGVVRRHAGGPALRGAITAMAIALFAAPLAGRLTPANRGLRPVLEQLARQRRPDDRIYAYYGAMYGMRFYAPGLGLDDAYEPGGCHRGAPRRYFHELDRFRGASRVWVVMATVSPWFEEDREMLSYLGAIGEARSAIVAGEASAHLFDLSDPARLAAASAERHRLVAPVRVEPYACESFEGGPPRAE